MAHQSPRGLTLAALREWRTRTQFADAILGRLLRKSDLQTADRAFTTELFYGILRNLSLLDFWIESLRSGRLDQDTRDLLRLGFYQLFLLETAQHAAVHESVELAGLRNRSLVNAVLRNAVRGKKELLEKANRQDLSVRSSHPQFLIDRWIRNFGPDEASVLCEWNNRPAPIYARVNHLKTSVEDFLAEVAPGRGLDRSPFDKNFVHVTTLPNDALAAGRCYVQDPSTAAACILLDPKPGERVLDACAAPGGKTGYIAELMNNEGVILACDRDQSRIGTLRDNLERLGVEIARFGEHNWTVDTPPPEVGAISPFDRVLVDAPCSNTGVMRRRVDLRWRLSPDDFARMQQEQLRILQATIPLLKPGGIFVYSTCSIEPEENEEVVRTLTERFPSLKLVDQVALLPFRDGVDGAFAAKLIREA